MNANASQDKSLVGTVLEQQYLVEEWLGEDASGTIYMARHMVLRRPAMLKIVHRYLSDDSDLVTELHGEIVESMKVSSPHAVLVDDFGRMADDRVYMTRPMIQGETLTGRLSAGKMGEAQVIELLGQVEDALTELHGLGLVHRSIRPGNIFISRRRGHDFLKVLELGTSTLAARCERPSAYMAPEQRRNEALDARADVYALAVTAYEMITGTLPYGDDEAEPTSAAPLVRQREPWVSQAFSAAVARALEIDAAKRQESVFDFIASIRGGGTPASAPGVAGATWPQRPQPARVTTLHGGAPDLSTAVPVPQPSQPANEPAQAGPPQAEPAEVPPPQAEPADAAVPAPSAHDDKQAPSALGLAAAGAPAAREGARSTSPGTSPARRTSRPGSGSYDKVRALFSGSADDFGQSGPNWRMIIIGVIGLAALVTVLLVVFGEDKESTTAAASAADASAPSSTAPPQTTVDAAAPATTVDAAAVAVAPDSAPPAKVAQPTPAPKPTPTVVATPKPKPAPKPVAKRPPPKATPRVTTPTPTPAPKPSGHAKPSQQQLAQAMKAVVAAREAYLAHEYKKAIGLAKQALKINPGRRDALQIAGVSACQVKDLKTARRSFRGLDEQRRQLLRSICGRNGLSLE